MTLPSNSDRVVVITGASSGIGRATALAFAGPGTRLVLSARSRLPLETLADACREAGSETIIAIADITVAETVSAVAGAAVASFGRIDVWVNTAAVMAYGRFEDVPAEVFDRVVDTNLRGSANVARIALARFRVQDSGVLILGGSLLSYIAVPYLGAYVTGKWGLRALARTLRQETRDAPRIHVCVVDPGSVDTPIYRSAANYAGRVGRPPPPVDSPEKVAAAIVRCARRPRPHVSVGLANPAIRFGFVALPAIYDRLVGPLIGVGGLSQEHVAPHVGNVFEAQPASADPSHGDWGRHWLRGVALAAGVVAVPAAALLRRRRVVTAARRDR